MFTAEDVVSTRSWLARLLRGILVAEGVTVEYFSHKYREYAFEVLGLDKQSANNARTNLVKAISKETLSPVMFQRALRALGQELINVTVTTCDVEDKQARVYDLHELECDVASRDFPREEDDPPPQDDRLVSNMKASVREKVSSNVKSFEF